MSKLLKEWNRLAFTDNTGKVITETINVGADEVTKYVEDNFEHTMLKNFQDMLAERIEGGDDSIDFGGLADWPQSKSGMDFQDLMEEVASWYDAYVTLLNDQLAGLPDEV